MQTNIEFVPILDGTFSFTVNGKPSTPEQQRILLHVLRTDPATRKAMTYASFHEQLPVPDSWPKD